MEVNVTKEHLPPMKIRVTEGSSVGYEGVSYQAGEVLEVSAPTAISIISQGAAVAVKE